MDRLRQPLLRQRRRGEQGFTLIELLVVIAVLAILAAIVIFNVVGVANKGKSNACQTDIQSTQTAVDAYLNDNPTTSIGSNPFGVSGTTTSQTLGASWVGWSALKPQYIHSIPVFSGTNNECTTTTATITVNHLSPAVDLSQGLTVTGS
jgi:prepilin-type N-terminal cleavage/methylation domain-containing protein